MIILQTSKFGIHVSSFLIFMRSCSTMTSGAKGFLLFFVVLFLLSNFACARSFIRIESVIPGIDKQPVNATLMDAVPILSSISASFSTVSEVDPESTLEAADDSVDDDNIGEYPDGNVIGELMPFSPLDGCEPLQPSIFTITPVANNASTKLLFSPSEQDSKVVVLMQMGGNCTIDRKLMMAQRIPSVVGIILIGSILPTDQDILLRGIKSRLIVFSVATGIGETLLSLTNWYRQHRILPVPPSGLPTLNDSSSSTTTILNLTAMDPNSNPTPAGTSQDDAWLRATLVTGFDTSTNLGVLEFALLIVVILLAVSFITSIILHFYFFHSRDQQGQMGNPETGLQHHQQQVLPESYLRYLPIRIYGDLATTLQDGLKKRTSVHGDNISTNGPATLDAINLNPAPSIPRAQSPECSATTISIIEMDSHVLTNNNIDNGQQARSMSTLRSGTSSTGNNSIVNIASPAPSIRSNSSWLMKTIRSSIHYFSSRKTSSSISFNDMCPVCIEDFSAKSKVRELPCQHIFHPECIDAWLVNRASSCPMCKFDCYHSLKRILEEKNIDESQNEENAGVERHASLLKKIQFIILKWLSSISSIFRRRRTGSQPPPIAALA